MSTRYSRLSEERLHKPSHGEVDDKTSDLQAHQQPQHRRVTSASNIRAPVHRQVMNPSLTNDFEVDFVPVEPPEGMDESQRVSWQAQWGEALKKVQSLRPAGNSQSERWSTDHHLSTSTPATSLDRWNYYPGPSVNRSSSWNNHHHHHPGSKLKGRGSRSVTSFEPPSAGPVLKKAISMREGGAHQDAVLQMARAAYTDTAAVVYSTGVPKTLNCDSCGRSLGMIVQGNNPGVEVAFCHACRPLKASKRKSTKKNVIMQFCRRMLRLKPSELISQ